MLPTLHEGDTLQLTRLDHEKGECAFFSVKNALICVWYGRGTEAGLARLEGNQRKLAAAHPRGISALHVVTGGILLPTPNARRYLAELTDAYWKDVACSAVVLLGKGFWASAMQSLVTGISTMRPRSSSLRVEESIHAGAVWLSEEHSKRTGVLLPAADLAAAGERALALATTTD